MAESGTDHRRATAERNVEAILAAAEALLARGAAASTTAVAAEAGVSRVTVYSHFPTREELLEAVTERSVARAGAALEAARLDDGPPPAALERLISTSWEEIDRNRLIAEAAQEGLDQAAFERTHERLHEPIVALIERGRAGGVFRDDLPTTWLLSSYFALMHACGREVRSGAVDAADAPRILYESLRGIWAAA